MESQQAGAAASPRGTVLDGVVDILEEMTKEWDTGFSGRIGPETFLMNNLTFESIDIVMLIVAVEERFGKKGMPFEELLMVDGHYVDDLKVSQIAAFLEKQLGAGATA
ncbi:MAG TPA: acyl carrier protein [Candidatus Polarisedimenticolia bacterium]|nr:acyl carrier protein [Candidatus Polarisedimenticolia bacterium]